jgi:polyisoprenoid-binding protein YceI
MKTLLITLTLLMTMSLSAQKYFTKTGEISFHSDAPMEKIEAVNTKATSVIDTESGAMQWSVLIKAFAFEKALMEEHFNENYMESSKFPKATFKGQIDNLAEIDFTKPGEYMVDVTGMLDIHGVSKEVKTKGLFKVTESGIEGNCSFTVLLADYGIEIPAVVADNISKSVDITIKADYKKLEQ